MQYTNTTDKNGLLQRIEYYTQLGDGVITGDTLTKARVTSDINEVIYDMTNEIILSDDSFQWDDPYKSDYPVATTPLTTERDYQFDSISFLKLNRVDVSWDGTRYYRATTFDSTSYMEGLGNDDQVDNNFSRTEPRYDPKAFGFWLYPRATATDVANGGKIRIEYQRAYTEFTTSDTTKQPPIDRPFHDLIAIGAALRNPNLPNDQYQKLSRMFGEKQPDGSWTGGMGRLLMHYGSRNEDEQLIFNPQIQDYT